MKHSQKEIAFQSGLSLATVDRVLHGRKGVRAATVLRVQAAIRELDGQAATSLLDGQRIAIDVVIEAPDRFSSAVKAAFEAELSGLRPASLRFRFHMAENFDDGHALKVLRQIKRRGTHGVVLKLPARGTLINQAGILINAGIPVVTLVTDLPVDRTAYIGMDNAAAGRTAAHLIQSMNLPKDGTILAVLSSSEFKGEVERVNALADALPDVWVATVQGGMGQLPATERLVGGRLKTLHNIVAVYSTGGANAAILSAFEKARKPKPVLIGHDLDRDNQWLLRDCHLDFVIHHDLRQDARSACQHILKSHRLLPTDFDIPDSAIQIATPFNI